MSQRKFYRVAPVLERELRGSVLPLLWEPILDLTDPDKQERSAPWPLRPFETWAFGYRPPRIIGDLGEPFDPHAHYHHDNANLSDKTTGLRIWFVTDQPLMYANEPINRTRVERLVLDARESMRGRSPEQYRRPVVSA